MTNCRKNFNFLNTSPLLFLVLVAMGCGKEWGRAGAAGDGAESAAVREYRKAVVALEPLETAALAAVASRTGDKYTDDAALLQALRDVALPRYREFVAALDGIAPAEPALQRFHARLRSLAAEELSVLERLAGAVERGDGTAVLLLNQEQRRVQAELEALITEFPGRNEPHLSGAAGTGARQGQ